MHPVPPLKLIADAFREDVEVLVSALQFLLHTRFEGFKVKVVEIRDVRRLNLVSRLGFGVWGFGFRALRFRASTCEGGLALSFFFFFFITLKPGVE